MIKSDNAKLVEKISMLGNKPTLVLSPSKSDEKYSDLINNISYHLAYQLKIQKNIFIQIKYFDNFELKIYVSYKKNFFKLNSCESKQLIDFTRIFIAFNSELSE